MLTPISPEQVTYVEDGNLLVTEHSDLGSPNLRQGVQLTIPCTTWQVTYAITLTNRDREGELRYWDLRPVNVPMPIADKLPTLRVFND